MQRCLLRFGQLRAEIRNHHVPAGEHAVAGRRSVQRAAARIDHLDAIAADIANAQHGAVQANARSGLAYDRASCSRRPRSRRLRASRPGIAAGISERTSRRAIDALPSGKWNVSEPPVAANPAGVNPMRGASPGSSFSPWNPGMLRAPAIERGDCIDAAAPPAVGGVQVVGQHAGVGLHDLQQVVLIGDARQPIFLLQRT